MRGIIISKKLFILPSLVRTMSKSLFVLFVELKLEQAFLVCDVSVVELRVHRASSASFAERNCVVVDF